jgi:hypothetical protein
MAALSSFLLCGMQSSPTGCTNSNSGRIGPSEGEVVGIGVGVTAAVVVGVVVLVEVNKSHHTIKGCVTNGPNGIEVQNESDKKTYSLVGVPASVKVGDIIRVHGSKEKKEKGSTANQDFKVAKMSRDYGPCKLSPAPGSPS